MGMNANAAWPESRHFLQPWHGRVVDAAGPLFTLLQAILAFVLLVRTGSRLAYPFVLSSLIMRILATGISVFNPNDEARLSLALGLGTWTLPLAMCIALLALTIAASRRLNAGAAFNALSVVLIVVFSSILILANQYAATR